MNWLLPAPYPKLSGFQFWDRLFWGSSQFSSVPPDKFWKQYLKLGCGRFLSATQIPIHCSLTILLVEATGPQSELVTAELNKSHTNNFLTKFRMIMCCVNADITLFRGGCDGWAWSNSGMRIIRGNLTAVPLRPPGILTWSVLGLNPGLRGRNSACNDLSYVTASE
jgi:hypothetical protein